MTRTLAQLRRERIEQPQLPVEALVTTVNQAWASLLAGVRVEPRRITVEFDRPPKALEKLLALR